MDRHNIRVCILRTGGTNCDVETERAFREIEVKAETVKSTKIKKNNSLSKYHVVVFPGGFSQGDYVRAGAIWGKEIYTKLGNDLRQFVEDGKLVLGICNGFQVLVEAGLLPAFSGISEYPEMTLATNASARYECRWASRDEYIYLKNENSGNCIFTRNMFKGKLLRFPIGHAEGRVLFPKESEGDCLKQLLLNDQLVFRYAKVNGTYANGLYPYNPNGSFYDIASICNPEGNVLGLMPHPERAFYSWQLPDYTRTDSRPEYGDGRLIFESIVEYLEEKF